MGKSFRNMYCYLRLCFWKWACGNIFDIAGLAIFSVLTASALENFLDAVVQLQMKLFYAGMIKLGFAVVVMFVFEGLYKRLFLDAMSCIRIHMQKDLFGKLICIPCKMEEKETTTEKLVRLNQDVDISISFIGEQLTSFLSGVVMAAVSTACIGSKNWMLGVFSFLILLGMIVVNLKYQPKQQTVAEKVIAQNGEIGNFFAETIRGGASLRINKMEDFAKKIFAGKAEALFDLKERERKYTLHQRMLSEGLSRLLILVLLAGGAVLCAERKLEVGGLFFVFQFGMNLLGYTNQVCNGFIVLSQAQAGIEHFFALLGEKEEKNYFGSEKISEEEIQLSLEDIRVDLPDKTILQNITLDMKKGEYIAIVGESGRGKSTLLKVLLQLVKQKGQYRINGKEIHQYSLAEFRKLFAYIPQKPELFLGSIRDNIACGKAKATEEEIKQAAILAGADDFIMQRPEQYETLIKEDGDNLSGGQRQKIAIARAFLKDASILLFDEHTSAMDTESETAIQKALEEMKGKKLIIMVAHREQTIDSAERIVEI